MKGNTTRIGARDPQLEVAAMMYSSQFSVRTDDKLKDEHNWTLVKQDLAFAAQGQ